MSQKTPQKSKGFKIIERSKNRQRFKKQTNVSKTWKVLKKQTKVSKNVSEKQTKVSKNKQLCKNVNKGLKKQTKDKKSIQRKKLYKFLKTLGKC